MQGVQVLELGQIITAPLAGMMLADLGAEVIKVENPEGGDPFRAFRGGDYSAHFTAFNRNKRSLTLNLRHPQARAVATRLIERADVLLENFRPDVMARLGFDAAALTKINPRLIHASITGFGKDGPYAQRPAFDSVGLALSGMASLFLDPADPQVRGPTLVDNISGMYACYGILGALYERARTGQGRRVEVNMLEAAIAFMPDPFANFNQMGLPQGPYSRSSASQSYALKCADGLMLMVHLSSQEKFWQGLLRAIGCEALGADPRFVDRMARVANYSAVCAELAGAFAQQPRAYWEARLIAQDVPFAPVNAIDEVAADAQVQHMQTFYAINHPTKGPQTGVHRPVRVDGERGPLHRAAPTLGEHTDTVLAELGFGPVEVAHFRSVGVV